jgi:fused signal recognition particle receptor
MMAKLTFSQKIKNFFLAHNDIDDDFFDGLCDALIEGDVGAALSWELVEEVKKNSRHSASRDQILGALKAQLLKYARPVDFELAGDKTHIFLVLGVNGVGKTTTIAKLAHCLKNTLSTLVIAASDTYRAAAIDQLKIHGERLGVRVIAHQDGADPAAVIFDAAEAVQSKGGGLVLADTAGRLHTKENLVRELQKIERVAETKASAGCLKKILVIDATTGQNAVRQSEVFHQAVNLDALVITKCDSSAKGGALFAIGKELDIPVFRMCFGESYENIAPFDPGEYAAGFLGL